MDRNSAKEIEFPPHVNTLDEMVDYLINCRRLGQNVCVNFNGYMLYSCDVTLDSAYLEVIGMSKSEDDAIRTEYFLAKTDEERDALIEKWTAIVNSNKKSLDNSSSNNRKNSL